MYAAGYVVGRPRGAVPTVSCATAHNVLTMCAAAVCNRDLRTAAAADSKTIECAHILAHNV